MGGDTLNSDHKADKSKLPAALEKLDWKERTGGELFYDQSQVLVAVPVNNRFGGGWYYEISCVTVHCDEDYFEVDLHGDDWGWSWFDVEWFVRLGAEPSPDEARN